MTGHRLCRYFQIPEVSQAQRLRTNKPFPSKHLLCNEVQQPFKQQSHKRSGHSLADTQRNWRSLHIEVLCNFFSIMAFTLRGMQTSVTCAVVLMHGAWHQQRIDACTIALQIPADSSEHHKWPKVCVNAT